MTTRVLIVDDDYAVRLLIKRFLETESSFEVVGEAANPSEALLIASQAEPDLVTMDYRMPGGNGDECIRELKSRWPEIHILALTSDDSRAAKRLLEAGAYVVIDKAHMELVIPAMYQIADRRESASRIGPGISFATDLSSQYGELRSLIASMEEETARQLADRKSKLAERLDLLVVLKAVLVATRNPNYSSDQALRAIKELVGAVLESDEHDVA